MEDLKARVAYLQGLAQGMPPGDTGENKIIHGIIDVLGDFAETISSIESQHEELEDYVESIDEDLYTLEDQVLDDESMDDDTDSYMEVKCPNCGETVYFDSSILEDDDVVEVICPQCEEVVFINDDGLAGADEGENLVAARSDDDVI